jgi:enoyl-CoA hydratase
MGTLVSYHLEDQIAAITLDDGKVNALSPAMFAELNEALDRAGADGAAVLLAGRPGVFSAGFDLGVLRGPDGAALVRTGFEVAARVLAFPAPVIVACTGHAIAMGLFLLLSGDYRVGAAGPYKFTANEVAIGVPVPETAMVIMRQRLAPSYFTRTVLAEPFGAGDAVAGGFLDRVVPDTELAAAAAGAAARMTALDRPAYAETKRRARRETLTALRAALDARQDRAAVAAPPAAGPAGG